MIDLKSLRKGEAQPARARLKGHTRRAEIRIRGEYEDQALPSLLGDGPAEKLEPSTLITLVLSLLSTACPGLGGILPPAAATAKAMKDPNNMQDAQHWRTCVKAARQEIVDSEIGTGKPGKGRHLKAARKNWRRRQRVLRDELTVTQDDAALRTYHANNASAARSSIAELTSLVEERRAAV